VPWGKAESRNCESRNKFQILPCDSELSRLLQKMARITMLCMSIGSIIEATPGICGGRARAAGTRVPVHRIARYHRLGYGPEEILGVLNSSSLSQIYAALACALANPNEIEESLREEDDMAGQLSWGKRI
jgi:uncharacterized protein (DUF433 family)